MRLSEILHSLQSRFSVRPVRRKNSQLRLERLEDRRVLSAVPSLMPVLDAAPSFLIASETIAAATTTQLSSSANPSVFGQSLTFTATVSPNSPVTETVGGTVNFTVDGGQAVAVTLSGGVAKLMTSSLGVGSHSVVATYVGSSAYGSSSASLAQTVGQANTITALSVPSLIGVGRSLTLSVNVLAREPGRGLPTGTVTFYDGTTVLGIGTIGAATGSANAAASLTLPTGLSAGVHQLSAVYGGDTNFRSSTSNPATVNVEAQATYMSLTSSVNPVLVGQPVTYSALVYTATTGTVPATPATGSVVFYDGDVVVATVPLTTGTQNTATAQFTTSYTAAGTHPLKAVYAGDTTHSSSYAQLTETVNSTRTAVQIALSSSANPSVVGRPVTLTVAVSGRGATGTITLKDGDATLASGPLDANGRFSFTSATLTQGTHPLTATYSGDGNFLGATSGILNQYVLAATTITLNSSVNPAQPGQAVTFSGVVSPTVPGSSVPTGTVTLWDGTTNLTPNPLVLNPNGVYSLTISTLTPGTHQIRVRYNGSSVYGASEASLYQVIAGRTATQLTSSVSPSVFGQSVIFTATVTPAAPATGTVSGTVNFTIDGGQPVAVALSGGVAKLTTSSLGVGPHTIVATYLGSSSYGSSSASLAQTVSQASTITALSVPSLIGVGRSLTLTANVLAREPGRGIPTGTVTFYDGTTVLGTQTIGAAVGTSAAVSLTLPTGLSAGIHQVSAVYSGDSNFQTSTSSPVSINVQTLATYLSLSSSINPVVVGQSVTYSALVYTATDNSPATPATGSVKFYDGDVLVATVPLTTGTQNTATAQFTTSYAAAGTHSIKAVYAGDATHSSSYAQLTETVSSTRSAVQVALSSSANPSVGGRPVTLTVAVSGRGATGTITLKDGDVTLASGPLDANGRFTFTTSSLIQGTHPITATYSGDGNFLGATSAVLNQYVLAATSITLNSSVNPAQPGQAVTFSGRVAPAVPGTSVPTGTVTLWDGSINLTPNPLVLDATGGYSLTLSTLTAGTHQIRVRYNGSSVYGVSEATLAQVVAGTTATQLSSSANPSVFGQLVTFTATVTPVAPATGTVSGTVNFTVDGGQAVAVALSGGVAKLTTSGLSVGPHTVVATYVGSSAYGGSSASLAQTVGQANTITALSVPSLIGVGRSLTLTANVLAREPGRGLPTGTVTFYDGTTVLGTGTIGAATGSANAAASLTLPTGLSAGVHQLSAVYGGDTNFLTSTSNPATVNVEAQATYMSLTSSVNPVLVGQPVTYSALVYTATTGTVPATPATGSVVFYDGDVVVATVPLTTGTQNTATAQFTTSYTAAGTHPLKAVYAGDTTHSSSYAQLTETVSSTRSAVQIALSSSANPSVVGRPVTLTVSVSGRGATGTITLKDGDVTLASGSLDANGRFSFTSSTLTQGTHPLTATYSGDGNFLGATSGILNQYVLAATTITLNSSVNPAQPGQAVTFSGVVSPTVPGSSVPTGTVTLWDGTTNLTPNPLVLNPNGVYSLTISTLTPGTHQIRVRYNGSSVYSTGEATLVFVVQTATNLPNEKVSTAIAK